MTTGRVKAYLQMWKDRCYSDGIPDELPELLVKTNRAPSWKKIAICILKNDLKLRGLGFTEAGYNAALIKSIEAANKDDPQMDLFS